MALSRREFFVIGGIGITGGVLFSTSALIRGGSQELATWKPVDLKHLPDDLWRDRSGSKNNYLVKLVLSAEKDALRIKNGGTSYVGLSFNLDADNIQKKLKFFGLGEKLTTQGEIYNLPYYQGDKPQEVVKVDRVINKVIQLAPYTTSLSFQRKETNQVLIDLRDLTVVCDPEKPHENCRTYQVVAHSHSQFNFGSVSFNNEQLAVFKYRTGGVAFYEDPDFSKVALEIFFQESSYLPEGTDIWKSGSNDSATANWNRQENRRQTELISERIDLSVFRTLIHNIFPEHGIY